MHAFLISVAWRSAWSRRFTLALVVLSIALSTFMLLGVERIRADMRDSFTSAVSGTDLIVGARTGSTQLLLYSVFHIGAATNNFRWSSVQALRQMRGVSWVAPLSLGDSHRGYPVLATSIEYFDHFRYGDRQALRFTAGKPFSDLFDAVIGAEVADKLGYKVGDHIILAHGSGGALQLAKHADKPFTVSGILARTGTPVDRTVHISLEAMEALHVDWMGGAPIPGLRITPDMVRKMNLQPKAVTAALVGLDNRAAVFAVQRQVNDFEDEPLMAILPGVALDELWDVLGSGEKALMLMSGLVALVSMAGLVSVVLAGLNERRRELAVLRAAGAGPGHILLLLALEGLLLTLAGIVIGIAVLVAALLALGPWLQSQYGLTLHLAEPTDTQWLLLCGLLCVGWLAGLLPAWRAYRFSLADGLSPKV